MLGSSALFQQARVSQDGIQGIEEQTAECLCSWRSDEVGSRMGIAASRVFVPPCSIEAVEKSAASDWPEQRRGQGRARVREEGAIEGQCRKHKRDAKGK